MTVESALLVVGGLHLGFQLVVAVVVYPALAETPPDRWEAAHAAHSHRISLVVAPLYVAIAAVCLWVLVAGPRDVTNLLAVAGHALAAGTTALVAAPTHTRLGREGPTPELLRRLRLADGVRLAGAVVGLAVLLA